MSDIVERATLKIELMLCSLCCNRLDDLPRTEPCEDCTPGYFDERERAGVISILGELEDEIERLRTENIEGGMDRDNDRLREENAALKAEIERLRAILEWVDDHAPNVASKARAAYGEKP